MLSFRLQQYFGPFTMLPVEGSSERRLFRHLSKHVFPRKFYPKYITYDVIFIGKGLKFNVDFKNAKKY